MKDKNEVRGHSVGKEANVRRVSSKGGNTRTMCEEYTSYCRKLATETVQIQHEERHEH